MENNLLIPIVNRKKKSKPYDLWLEDNKEDLIFTYNLIKNYDTKINFLNNCNFSIFCSFCYKKSST